MGILNIGDHTIANQGIVKGLNILIENDQVIFAEMKKQTALLERIAVAAEQTARATDHMARQRV